MRREAEERIKLLSPKAGDVVVVRGVGDSTDQALYEAMAMQMEASAIDKGVLVIFVGPGEAIDRMDANDMAEYGWAYLGEEKAKEWAASHFNPGE
jgi:hypothetical protein